MKIKRKIFVWLLTSKATFHSYRFTHPFNAKINKFCPKRVKFSEKQHRARIWSCVNSWMSNHECEFYNGWDDECLREYDLIQ